MSVTIPSNSRHILTPTKLNRLTRTLLQNEIGTVWLSGEISNFVAAGSGHWYFTLKDNKAQVRAAMFRQANFKVAKRPQEGDKVLLKASVSLYEPRGDYQLIVEHMEAEGEGALKRELERLKLELSNEGLFDADKKRPIPAKLTTIGVITSASGAALHDVLTVLKRRAPDIEVIVYPTLVQGDQAPAQLIKALSIANQRAEVDVLLITRGGGSLEDLWAFNDAGLARQIASSPMVVVSAVGHEVDITISDLVADVRAPTPSAAAELLSPDRAERLARIQRLEQTLQSSLSNVLDVKKASLKALHNTLRLLHPSRQLMQHAQNLDSLTLRLHNLAQRQLQAHQLRLHNSASRLYNQGPDKWVDQSKSRHAAVVKALHSEWQSILRNKQQQLERFAGHLHTLSPLATLSRGYSIALQDDKAVTSVNAIDMSKPIVTRFHDGEVVSDPKTKH